MKQPTPISALSAALLLIAGLASGGAMAADDQGEAPSTPPAEAEAEPECD